MKPARVMATDAPSTSGQSRDVAAMASAVEIEDETVVALRAALGRTIDSHEVEAFLRAVGVKDVNGDVTDRKKFPPSSEFVNYRPHGVSLCFENGKLDTVHCYSRGVDGYGEFAGALPSGIAMTSAAVDVARALGEPTTKGGVGRMIWLSYDHMGIKFDIAATDWEEPDASIRSVAIWDAN